jgi:hypothetical protein
MCAFTGLDCAVLQDCNARVRLATAAAMAVEKMKIKGVILMR